MMYLIIGLMAVIFWVLLRRLILIIGFLAFAGVLYFFMTDNPKNLRKIIAKNIEEIENLVGSEAQTVHNFYSAMSNSKDNIVNTLTLLSNSGRGKNTQISQFTTNKSSFNKVKNITKRISNYDPKKEKIYNDVQNKIEEINNFSIKNEALLYAVSKDLVKVAEGLIKIGADINFRDQYGRTPLIIASTYYQFKMAEMLLKNYANRNKRDNDHHTALMRATLMNDIATFKILVTNDTDPTSLKNKGDSLIIAARLGYTEMVKILLQNQADVNEKDEKGRTPLMISAEKGYQKIIQALLENNADINAKDNENNTALMIAKKKNRTEIIKLLKSAGAKE